MSKRKPILVGITGGTGCGQSTVAGLFKKWGAKVISADLVARQVVDRDTQVRQEIKRAFGAQLFFRNGQINRKQLGNLVFTDSSKVQQLNQIVHPRMVAKIVDQIEVANESPKYKMIAIDAALIFEANLEQMFDVLIVVSAKTSNRIERIMKRDGLTEREIQRRIKSQIPISDKILWADIVIHNNYNLEQLENKARKAFQSILPVNTRGAKKRTPKK